MKQLELSADRTQAGVIASPSAHRLWSITYRSNLPPPAASRTAPLRATLSATARQERAGVKTLLSATPPEDVAIIAMNVKPNLLIISPSIRKSVMIGANGLQDWRGGAGSRDHTPGRYPPPSAERSWNETTPPPSPLPSGDRRQSIGMQMMAFATTNNN